mgnify:CR=1 FL=1
MITNCNSGNPDCYLRADAICLPDVLHENGYECGYIGKWHLECPEEKDYPYLPPRRWDGNIWDAYTPKGAQARIYLLAFLRLLRQPFRAPLLGNGREAKDCLHDKAVGAGA